jgi:hypothetical protein
MSARNELARFHPSAYTLAVGYLSGTTRDPIFLEICGPAAPGSVKRAGVT